MTPIKTLTLLKMQFTRPAGDGDKYTTVLTKRAQVLVACSISELTNIAHHYGWHWIVQLINLIKN